eukprot:g78832.t1
MKELPKCMSKETKRRNNRPAAPTTRQSRSMTLKNKPPQAEAVFSQMMRITPKLGKVSAERPVGHTRFLTLTTLGDWVALAELMLGLPYRELGEHCSHVGS